MQQKTTDRTIKSIKPCVRLGVAVQPDTWLMHWYRTVAPKSHHINSVMLLIVGCLLSMPVASRIPVGECSLGRHPSVSPTRVDVCRNLILLKRVRRVCLAADACAVEWACVCMKVFTARGGRMVTMGTVTHDRQTLIGVIIGCVE